jgi:hypothetical protein
VRQREVRETARNRPDHGDAAPGEVEDGARRNRARDGEEGTWHARCEDAAAEHHHHHRRRQAQRRSVHVVELADELADLFDGPPAVQRDAHHLPQDGDADLNADAGEESDQHRLREEVGEEAELEQPRRQQADGGQQRHQARQGHVVVAGDRRHRHQPAGEDRCRRRIRRYHQVAR